MIEIGDSYSKQYIEMQILLYKFLSINIDRMEVWNDGSKI